jgi:hypothetical protein
VRGGRPPGSARAEAVEELVGHAEVLGQAAPALLGVGDEGGEVGAEGRGVVVGRGRVEGVGDLEQAHHLLEREAERLHAADEEEALEVVVRVEAEAAVGAAGRAQQAGLVVVAERAVRQAGALGELADLHGRGTGGTRHAGLQADSPLT